MRRPCTIVCKDRPTHGFKSSGQHDLACCTQLYPLPIERVFGARITAEDLHVTAMNGEFI